MIRPQRSVSLRMRLANYSGVPPAAVMPPLASVSRASGIASAAAPWDLEPRGNAGGLRRNRS